MDSIDRIRAFNRFYTRRLGLLSRSYLGSGLGLGEVRLLHELGTGGPWHARDLANRLEMDEAQVSRSLAGFVRRGWLLRQVAGGDARLRRLELTEAGRAEVAALIQRSREALGAALADLEPDRQQALAAALDRVEALLTPAATAAPPEAPDVVLRDPRPGDMGWVVAAHGAHYAASDGFDSSFEALVAEIAAAFLRSHDPETERGWIAARDAGAEGERLGSIFCVHEAPGLARLRLFYVCPAARGTGLAQRMLDHCLGFARAAGYRRMRLSTHESHRAACRLYARNGFALMRSDPILAYGQPMVAQVWERDL